VRARPGWAADLTLAGYGPGGYTRLVAATTDPATLPAASTWYVGTNPPHPQVAPATESALAPADLAEIVRLYGLRQWVEQGYRQVKGALGWADFQVRSDRAIRRHWQLSSAVPSRSADGPTSADRPLLWSIRRPRRPPPRQRGRRGEQDAPRGNARCCRGRWRCGRCRVGWTRGPCPGGTGVPGRARPRRPLCKRCLRPSRAGGRCTSRSAFNKLPIARTAQSGKKPVLAGVAYYRPWQRQPARA
jgi:hypothetical protein